MPKEKQRTVSVAIAVFCAVFGLLFILCRSFAEENAGSEGLIYGMTSDGQGCVLLGIGDCTDKTIEIPSAYKGQPVLEIGRGAFLNDGTIEAVYFPSTIQKVGEEAFRNCTGLLDVGFNEGLTELGIGAFQGCSSLMTAILPSTLETVPEGAFSGCSALFEAVLPEVKEIGKDAFRDRKSVV